MFLIERSRPLLIVDPDPNLLLELQADPYINLAPPLMGRTPDEALSLLGDRSQIYSGIFINPKTCATGGMSIVRAAHSMRAGTPLYFLCDKGEAPRLAEAELKALGIHQVVHKPVRYGELVGLVAPLITMFEVEALLSRARAHTYPIEIELSAEDNDFLPVLAENFLSGRKTFFDVYIRLKTGRYIKALSAGDAFSGERLHRFVRKGIYMFYLRRDSQENFLDQATRRIGSSDTAPSAETITRGAGGATDAI